MNITEMEHNGKLKSTFRSSRGIIIRERNRKRRQREKQAEKPVKRRKKNNTQDTESLTITLLISKKIKEENWCFIHLCKKNQRQQSPGL